MVMRADDVLDPFVGKEPFHLRDHRQGPRFVERCLDDGHEIAEPDSYTVVGTACQVEHSVSQPLRLYSNGRNRRSLDCLGHRDRLATDVRLDVGYRDAK